MRFSATFPAALAIWAACTFAAPVHAAETLPVQEVQPQPVSFIDRTVDNVEAALDRALDLIGIKYRRGGNTPESGFDCSGFVRHVFNEGVGLYLPRSAKEMSKAGDEVHKEELKPGDLVFFKTRRSSRINHVGIYAGNGKFVHSSSGKGQVRVDSLNSGYYANRLVKAKRVANSKTASKPAAPPRSTPCAVTSATSTR